MNAIPQATDHDYAHFTAADTVCIERLLPGPIERVWAYLADGELRRQWLAGGAMPPREGGEFELVWRNDELTDPPGARPEGFGEEHRMQGRILDFDPPRRLAFTWSGDSEVSIELAPRGKDVLLTLVHQRLSGHERQVMHCAGWHMHLVVLADKLAGRRGETFWDGWLRLRAEYEQRLAGDAP